MRDGWVETTFGDIFKIVAGKYVAKEEYVEGGEFWIYGSNSIMGKLDRFLVEQSHVVMAAIGAYAGAVRYSKEPSWINNNAMALVPSEKIMAKYLHLWLESKFDLKRVVVGTGQPYVQRPLLLKEIISLPPLPEQKRIVDLISSVDFYIDALQQQLESAKRSRNAVLHELLTAGGEDWVEKTLDLVTECSWGNTETTKSKYVDSGYLAYSASGADGFLDWFEHDRTAVVLSAIGAQCGKTWFAEGKWTSIKNTIWLKADNLNLLDKYLFYLSNRDQFWQIRGQAQPFISLGDVKKTKVLLPPIVEQERIIQVISGLDSFQDSLTACLNSSKNLRAGILSSLLSGEHEIPASYDKVLGAA